MAYPSSNNKLRILSGNSTTDGATYKRLSDTDLASATAQNGAAYGQTANSALYNSLSLSLSLPVVAFVECLAEANSLTNFGQGLAIENWISSIKNTFALKSTVDALSTSVDNIINGTTTVGSATEAQYASSDHSKGTIEERLTSLGFREGSAVFDSSASSYINTNTSYINLYRQGNYVIGKVKLNFSSITAKYNFLQHSGLLATLPTNFTIKSGTNARCFFGTVINCRYSTGGTSTATAAIAFSNEFIISGSSINLQAALQASSSHIQPFSDNGAYDIEFQFGYEAQPIT